MTEHDPAVDLAEEVETLRHELAELRTVVAQLRSAGGASPCPAPPTAVEQPSTWSSRRQLLRQGGLAVGAGLAAAGAIGRPAAAAPGDAVVQDGHTVGSGNTTVESTRNLGGVGITGWASATPSQSTVGVRGICDGLGSGVHGLAKSEGFGVWGQSRSSSGIGVVGSLGHSEPLAGTGSPEHLGGAGVVGYAGLGVAGVHGRWQGFDPEHGTGVLGSCDTPGSTAVHGNAEAGTGVRGTSLDGHGGAFGGTTANVALEPVGPPPTTRSDAHEVGELYFDDAHDLWVCVEAGSPGFWRNLTAPRLVATTPFRVYDSRFGGGFLAAGASRRIPVRDAIDLVTGEVYWPDATPQGAVAVTFNITVTQTVNGGFLATTPGDATDFHTASVNWSASGATVGNATLVDLDDSRRMRVFAGGEAGAGAHFIIDVTGYLV